LNSDDLSTKQKIRQDEQDEQDFFIFHHNKFQIYNRLDNAIVTSQKVRVHHVIPAKAGIQLWLEISMDSGFRRNDNRVEKIFFPRSY